MKTTHVLVIVFLMLTTNLLNAQQVIKLWEGNPPTDNGLKEPELTQDGRVSSVSVPELIAYLPNDSVNKNIGVIICPGGGYARLAINHEGHDFAKWLQSKGIAAFILKYRMPNKRKQVPLEDLEKALSYVRSNADLYHLSSDKIGVAGFSAGGHLASTASTHLTANNVRPNFSILFYPVITMGDKTHDGSKLNLLGDSISAGEVMFYSNEKRVNEFTPPTILLLSDDDTTVSSLNSVMYYDALKDHNIPATMYIFPEGGHGWGMRDSFKYHKQMLSLLEMWLDDLN